MARGEAAGAPVSTSLDLSRSPSGFQRRSAYVAQFAFMEQAEAAAVDDDDGSSDSDVASVPSLSSSPSLASRCHSEMGTQVTPTCASQPPRLRVTSPSSPMPPEEVYAPQFRQLAMSPSVRAAGCEPTHSAAGLMIEVEKGQTGSYAQAARDAINARRERTSVERICASDASDDAPRPAPKSQSTVRATGSSMAMQQSLSWHDARISGEDLDVFPADRQTSGRSVRDMTMLLEGRGSSTLVGE